MEEAVSVAPLVVAEASAAEESTSAATSSSSSLPSGEGGEESGEQAPTNKNEKGGYEARCYPWRQTKGCQDYRSG